MELVSEAERERAGRQGCAYCAGGKWAPGRGGPLVALGCGEWVGRLECKAGEGVAWPRCSSCVVQLVCRECYKRNKGRIECADPTLRVVDCAGCGGNRASHTDYGRFDPDLSKPPGEGFFWWCDDCLTALELDSSDDEAMDDWLWLHERQAAHLPAAQKRFRPND
jgi:hypothetical protein